MELSQSHVLTLSVVTWIDLVLEIRKRYDTNFLVKMHLFFVREMMVGSIFMMSHPLNINYKKIFFAKKDIFAKRCLVQIFCFNVLKSVGPNGFKTIDRSLVTFFLLNLFKATVLFKTYFESFVYLTQTSDDSRLHLQSWPSLLHSSSNALRLQYVLFCVCI